VSWFIPLGVIAALSGLVILVTAIRHQSEQQPKYKAMLIGGMMLTAFGIVIAGFAIAYQRTPPLALNAAVPAP
jgi:Na+-translocating ferredoxin:NAD+ oxidoreductase RnfD subunit